MNDHPSAAMTTAVHPILVPREIADSVFVVRWLVAEGVVPILLPDAARVVAAIRQVMR